MGIDTLRRTQRETRDEAVGIDAGVQVVRREVGGIRHAEGDHARPRHAAPQRRECIVGVDHRGGGRLEARDHFALGARHAFDAAETLEVFGAGVGDEAHRGTRELHQRGHFAGMIGADLDDRVAMRGRRAGAA